MCVIKNVTIYVIFRLTHTGHSFSIRKKKRNTQYCESSLQPYTLIIDSTLASSRGNSLDYRKWDRIQFRMKITCHVSCSFIMFVALVRCQNSCIFNKWKKCSMVDLDLWPYLASLVSKHMTSNAWIPYMTSQTNGGIKARTQLIIVYI